MLILIHVLFYRLFERKDANSPVFSFVIGKFQNITWSQKQSLRGIIAIFILMRHKQLRNNTYYPGTKIGLHSVLRAYPEIISHISPNTWTWSIHTYESITMYCHHT